MNTDELEWALMKAERRVLEIQTKLHRWAVDDSHRRFDDLFNLVADPAFLLVAWDRVRGNKGARTAGVDGKTARSIEAGQGVEAFLDKLRTQVRDRSFHPVPVRERMIPKANGKLRRLGIPTVADRVVQASLKLVLEPVFEADFLPCSYGFRPNRRAHDAIAETRYLASHGYEWVVEGDITACFAHTVSGTGHGRRESRSLKTMAIAANLGGIAFPEARLALRIHRRRQESGKRQARETVYAVTSLDTHQASPVDLGGYVRGHWAIENSSHHVRDVVFAEDASTVHAGSAPRAMAALRNLAIGRLRLLGADNIAKTTRAIRDAPEHAVWIWGITDSPLLPGT